MSAAMIAASRRSTRTIGIRCLPAYSQQVTASIFAASTTASNRNGGGHRPSGSMTGQRETSHSDCQRRMAADGAFRKWLRSLPTSGVQPNADSRIAAFGNAVEGVHRQFHVGPDRRGCRRASWPSGRRYGALGRRRSPKSSAPPPCAAGVHLTPSRTGMSVPNSSMNSGTKEGGTKVSSLTVACAEARGILSGLQTKKSGIRRLRI